MRPDTIFEYIDQSIITKSPVNKVIAPTYLQVFSCDRGPEKFMELSGDSFFKYYGSTISFEKHGQPLVQAAHIIDNGGKVLCKRVVAPDATLANISIIAKVSKAEVQKVDNTGKPLYTDASTGQETTVADGNTALMINTASIKYDAVTVPDVSTLEEIQDEVVKSLDDAGTDDVFSYPLFTVTDNGRGVSTKRFRIEPDRNVSKNLDFQLYYIYNLGVLNMDLEYSRFCIDHEIVYLNKSMSLSMASKDLIQINAKCYESNTDLFLAKIAEISGLELDYLKSIDVLFGCDKKGTSIPQISIDTTGYNLSDELGITLQSGDNGSFGDKPLDSADYSKELIKVFDGTFDDSVWDLNRYTIDGIFDANYPLEVKKCILELAKFREDFFFFRDIGIGYNTYSSIIDQAANLEHNKFSATYITSYEVIDPYGKKQIPVTITYDLAVAMIDHFNERRHRPAAGIQFGFVFPNVVEGTVNFCPKKTPTVDQKTEFADSFLNYASYINGQLTIETEHTSQDPFTQFSFINNILSVQEVIHAVRKECPSYRYSFITSEDLEEYQTKVNNVIKQFKDRFATLEFKYTSDPTMAANKLFNASIEVSFKDFVQTEIFKIYALPTTY